VGLCGTDAHIFEGRFPAVPRTVLGHEIAGEIVEVGDDVDCLARGDLVAVEPHLYCGRCHFCRVGAEHLCLKKQAFGIHLDGGLATHLVVPAGCAYKVPDAIGPDAAALCEPLGCCVHGMDRLGPRLGDSMLIIGAGPAGLLLTRLAALRGVSPLVVCDLLPERRDVAKFFGADHVVDPGSQAAPQAFADATAGLGFSTVIEAVGTAATFEFAIAHAAQGGRIMIFGAASQDDRAEVKPFEIFAKELTVIGTVRNPYTHKRALSLLPRIPVHDLDIQKYDLDHVHSAIEAQQRGIGTKIIVCP
jgi:2-desacetyl-2-hydroxyethyl bacteriochlorophyllide A dehydrogenase